MATRKIGSGMGGRDRGRWAILASLALGAALAGAVALAGTAHRADASLADRIVFTSNRVAGPGVDNPTGDYEIFRMNPDGTGVRQLTSNKRNDFEPVISSDGSKVAYVTYGKQPSNPEGDNEVYVMSASDGSGKKNLSNSGANVSDRSPHFSPGGGRVAYESYGIQSSNPEGDSEIYVVSAVNGTGKKNLTHNGVEVSGENAVDDYMPEFSPDGKTIAYTSVGKQASNLEGDYEVYSMGALDGSGKKNLSNSGADVDDHNPEFSPDGARISYTSFGEQTSNSEGDYEIYVMSAPDGSGQTNLTNNDVFDFSPQFSPGGKKIVYNSFGPQTSNPEGDYEVYRMNAGDGSDQTNLSNNGADIDEFRPDFSKDGTSVVYESEGIQRSNPEGDREMYRANTLDGKGKRNLTDNKVAYDGYYLPGQM